LTKVDRRVIWRRRHADDYHDAIECAVRADGSSPAVEFWVTLQHGNWREDPRHKPPRDPDQIYDWEQLWAKIAYVGREGCPPTGESVNHLDDGIWEFKHADRRLSFWDTPGDGTYVAKEKVDRRVSEGPENCPFLWYPKMDRVLRLGCAWPKEGRLAPPERIEEAKAIREEDCAHDRDAPGTAELEPGDA